MATRRRPHPAARSRRAAAWLSVGVATTLGTGMAINGAISSSGAAQATSSDSTAQAPANQQSSAQRSTTTTVKRSATPSTTVPKSSRSRTRAS